MAEESVKSENKLKRRIYSIVMPAENGDAASKLFDSVILVCILVSIFNIIASTFSDLETWIVSTLAVVEIITTIIFTIEYLMRLYCCEYIYKGKYKGVKAKLRYSVSFFAIVDLFSILPMYIAILFGVNLRALAAVKIFRILRIFKIKSFSNALMTVINVIKRKSSQLLASLSVILLLMLISSIIMFYIENPSQPDVYQNAFSGLWWSVATFTTVGYGDIYPITMMGKLFASVIAFLGIGLVAVPTGIISSGFVEEIVTSKKSESEQVDNAELVIVTAEVVSEKIDISSDELSETQSEQAGADKVTMHCPYCGKSCEIKSKDNELDK